MLSEQKLKVLIDLVRSSGQEELTWMSGYVAGAAATAQQLPVQSQAYGQQDALPQAAASLRSAAAGQSAQAQPQAAVATAVAAAPAIRKITIAYGTESGNSKKLATDFAVKAKKIGINAKVVSLDQYRVNDLSKEEYFFTVISTQGDVSDESTLMIMFVWNRCWSRKARGDSLASMRTAIITSIGTFLVFAGATAASAQSSVINKWPPHAKDRPRPPVVTPSAFVATPAPPDAVVLFDGTSLSSWTGQENRPVRWRVRR